MIMCISSLKFVDVFYRTKSSITTCNRVITFEVAQRLWPRYTQVTDEPRQTDRQFFSTVAIQLFAWCGNYSRHRQNPSSSFQVQSVDYFCLLNET